ncbi:MAG: hypothetical protein GF308_11365 [Candidatus Heimdallarchaeota archaeon]|nr:hypothetical protein [Candidatus Heimdallarchaeota archaeon]
MVNTLTGYYLIASIISAGMNIFLFFMLIFHFLKKRTIGTLVLSSSFLVTAIGEIIFSAVFWYQAIAQNVSYEVSKVVFFIGIFILGLNSYFYYFFVNRHIVRDNDFIKSVVALFFVAILSISLGLAIPEILQNPENPTFFVNVALENTPIQFAVIPLLVFILLLPISSYFAFGRAIYRSIKIQLKSKDPIAKNGFKFTWIASVLHIIGAAFKIALYIFDFAQQVVPSLFIYTIGTLTTIVALIFYYLGWVMPPWLKRRLREKAWFTKIYTGEEREPDLKALSTKRSSKTSVTDVPVNE